MSDQKYLWCSVLFWEQESITGWKCCLEVAIFVGDVVGKSEKLLRKKMTYSHGDEEKQALRAQATATRKRIKARFMRKPFRGRKCKEGIYTSRWFYRSEVPGNHDIMEWAKDLEIDPQKLFDALRPQEEA